MDTLLSLDIVGRAMVLLQRCAKVYQLPMESLNLSEEWMVGAVGGKVGRSGGGEGVDTWIGT